MNNEIKTWQQRLEEHNSTNPVLKNKMGALWDAPDAMRAEIADLRAHIESLAADAERYKFLRHADLDALQQTYYPGGDVPEGNEFDKIIDAAIAKEKA